MSKIFLVDDNKTQRKIISSCIKNIEGITLTEFDSSVDLLAASKINPPDLVITDFVLPDLTGLELIVKMRRQNKDCKFIIVTSGFEANLLPDHFDHSYIEQVYKAPIIYKPVSSNVLNRTVTALLNDELGGEKTTIIGLPDSSDEYASKFYYHLGEKVFVNQVEDDMAKVAKICLNGYGSWTKKQNLKL